MSQLNVSDVQAKRKRLMQQSHTGSMPYSYVSGPDGMKFFFDNLRQFQADGKIPDLKMEAEYTIYRWKSGFGRHESIVVGCQGKFFTIEIRVIEYKDLVLFTISESFDVTKFKECGKKITTGLELISKACQVFQKVDYYNLAFYNCQHFVNDFLEANGMIDQVRDTDSHWLFKIGTIGTIVVTVVGTLLYFVLKSKR